MHLAMKKKHLNFPCRPLHLLVYCIYIKKHGNCIVAAFSLRSGLLRATHVLTKEKSEKIPCLGSDLQCKYTLKDAKTPDRSSWILICFSCKTFHFKRTINSSSCINYRDEAFLLKQNSSTLNYFLQW